MSKSVPFFAIFHPKWDMSLLFISRKPIRGNSLRQFHARANRGRRWDI
jgi:hypothetical protein